MAVDTSSLSITCKVRTSPHVTVAILCTVGTELKSPEFVRGPPPPSSGEDIPESEREAGKHHVLL